MAKRWLTDTLNRADVTRDSGTVRHIRTLDQIESELMDACNRVIDAEAAEHQASINTEHAKQARLELQAELQDRLKAVMDGWRFVREDVQ